MEIVLAAVVVTLCIGLACGVLGVIMVMYCCCSSLPSVASADAGSSRWSASDYEESWLCIVSDEKRVYHWDPECSSLRRTSKSSFRWYRVCKLCADAAKPAFKKQK